MGRNDGSKQGRRIGRVVASSPASRGPRRNVATLGGSSFQSRRICLQLSIVWRERKRDVGRSNRPSIFWTRQDAARLRGYCAGRNAKRKNARAAQGRCKICRSRQSREERIPGQYEP